MQVASYNNKSKNHTSYSYSYSITFGRILLSTSFKLSELVKNKSTGFKTGQQKSTSFKTRQLTTRLNRVDQFCNGSTGFETGIT